jgi:hypothetical protein
LWIECDAGFRFKDWHDWQPTREKVEAERSAARERMRAARERKKASRSGEVRANTSATEANVRERSGEVRSTPGSVTPTRPDPTRPDPKDVSDSAAAPSPRAQLALVADAPTAQTLVGEWIDHCPERPPGRVIGQVSKELKSLLDEGIDPERVRRALAEWNRKGLHPSTLPSVVHEIGNRAPTKTNRQAAEDAMWERAMDRAIEREREMGLRP